MQKSNDDMGRDELRQKIRQAKFEAEGLAVALSNMDSALDETGQKHWQQMRRSIEVMNEAFRKLSPEVAGLTLHVVKAALIMRITEGTPSELTYLVRTLLTEYLGLKGGLFDAAYAQLTRGAEAGKLLMEDPEVKDLTRQIGAAMSALVEQNPSLTGSAAVRHVCAWAVIASTLHFLCADSALTRRQFGDSFLYLLIVSGMSHDTQLELIFEG